MIVTVIPSMAIGSAMKSKAIRPIVHGGSLHTVGTRKERGKKMIKARW